MCYTGENGVYTDASVALPIVALPFFVLTENGDKAMAGPQIFALLGNDGDGTALSFRPPAGRTEVEMPSTQVFERIKKKLTVSSPNWYFGSDRTLYICGGPSNVQRESDTFQRILLDHDEDFPQLYISEQRP